MNFKDRTSEFFNLVERIQKRGTGVHQHKKQALRTNVKSEFARMAAQLGRSIAATSEKLEQLTYLTKGQYGLQDRPMEINTLTQDIKNDITKLNNQLKIIQSVSKSNTRNKQATEHSQNVILSLQNNLANTSLGFKDVLESTQVTNSVPMVQQQETRRRNVSHYNHQQQQQVYEETPQSLGIPMISQQMLVEQHDRQIESRSNTMETIESTIAELGSIFQQLATMVSEQRETIQRIDQNTNDIEMNVLGAQNELLKYFTNMSSNRGFIIKVFLTVIALFLFFSMIM